ncbi:hypothetical protein OsI_23550 [Oryza sativa Indica Group]|uniref:Uncharacterized protein n=1 Tax=Oryza sativa subsp. indica TaxID=39946 RepID=B8B467_ORYSI|nr:hypothetical protein OsI_23550 [Oryza sativa Indica Group]
MERLTRRAEENGGGGNGNRSVAVRRMFRRAAQRRSVKRLSLAMWASKSERWRRVAIRVEGWEREAGHGLGVSLQDVGLSEGYPHAGEGVIGVQVRR